MKSVLQRSVILPLVLCSLATTTIPVFGDGMVPRGTDILHYGIKKLMVNEGVEPNATGRVDLRQNHQGRVTVQMLDIVVRKLNASTPYQVIKPVDPADPAQAPVVVASFTTDRRGNANLRFRDIAHENGSTVTMGRGRLLLPDSVNPLLEVKKLVVMDTNEVAVLIADLSVPTHLTYLVKRDVSTDTIRASLRIVANNVAAYVRLDAWRLAPSTDYQLLLNGGAAETFTTDAAGRLVVRSRMENPLDVLSLHSLQVHDPANIVVLSATLP